MRLIGLTAVMAFGMSACSQLKVEELPASETGLKPLVLGKVEFNGGTVSVDGENLGDTVTVFPGETVNIRCSTVNATGGEITYTSNSGFTPGSTELRATTFPDCSKTQIDTTNWVPGIYTASVMIAGDAGTPITNTFTINVKPRVEITKAEVSGGNAILDLYYEYGVGEGGLTVNGQNVSSFPRVINQNSAHTVRNIVVPLANISGNTTFVATVSMNGIDGNEDNEVLSNRAPIFTGTAGVFTNSSGTSVDARRYQVCRLLGESDFGSFRLLGTDTHPTPSWGWNANEVRTLTNVEPSMLPALNSSVPFSVTGSWQTTSSDDDFWGLIAGYKNETDYHLFDWKKGAQNFSPAVGASGARIRHVTVGPQTAGPQFWSRADKDGFNTVGTPTEAPWESNTRYAFEMKVNPTSLKIVVVNDTTNAKVVDMEVTADMTGGWGLYTYSQDNSIFSDMNRCPYEGAPAAYSYQPTATDADGDTLAYRITGPTGIGINSSTGAVSWRTPIVGNHPITIQVTDGRGGSVSQNYTLTVSN